ncbi:putative membrane protein YdgH [Paenibacillus larvae subsp. larvae]|uniref:Putative membrane protein YdgH n=1 Tax=Paenibacillus larvae subsp. larvae TaxID=147375 RepID=A0A2L1UJ24_9BACL|nr:putative membrane protein YdgH [Paenibacillus larvae subsp. larvae]AVF32927.1 putative membrane protein YdgH [Paenibacillus larvae subsp. larvae]
MPNEKVKKLENYLPCLVDNHYCRSLATMPNLDQLVREKGQITIPKMEQSNVANEMIKQMDKKSGGTEIIAVFNSGSEKALTNEQKEQISSVIYMN